MTSHRQIPSLPALLFHRPPVLAFILLGLAALLLMAPEPTSPDPKGVSAQVLALPMFVLACVAVVPTVLRALSQRRALWANNPLECRVTAVQDHTATEGLPRHRILWTEPSGRNGRSPVIKGWWVPPVGSRIHVYPDPTKGVGWWVGSLPGAIVKLPQGQGRAGAPRSAILQTVSFWIAAFAIGVAIVLAMSDAPRFLPLGLCLIAAYTGQRAMAEFRAQDRALRYGERVKAQVTGHRGKGVDTGANAFAMDWRSKAGHFGQTGYVSGKKLTAVGRSITVAIDPQTHRAWWDEG